MTSTIPPTEEELAAFRAAQARQAAINEAKRGNGSDSAFVRWLTRKPLPIKFTPYRAICGLCWTVWTLIFTLGVLFVSGTSAHLAAFVFAVLCGLYAFRIWTRRATYLTLFIVF